MDEGYSLGIDLGTTYTAAAIARDGRVEAFVIDGPTAEASMPSVVFASEEGLVFGRPAERLGAAHPERMTREFKRRVGDETQIWLAGSHYSAERLMALLASHVVDAVKARLNAPPMGIAVTYPARWTDHQRKLLRNALAGVGLPDVQLISEPKAAAWEYVTTTRLANDSLVLVYDLGGGTLDVALLRMGKGRFEHVIPPTGDEQLGGVDFDDVMFEFVERSIPKQVLDRVRQEPEGVAQLAHVRRLCVDAKESLSSDVSADVPILLPGHTTTVRITRHEFEAKISPAVRQTIAVVTDALARAGVTPGQLAAVLMIGGSSRIPRVAELMAERLDIPVLVDAHPKLVVAKGAARRVLSGTDETVDRRRPEELGRRRRRRQIALGASCAVALGVVVVGAAVALGGQDESAGREGSSIDGADPGSLPTATTAAATAASSASPSVVTEPAVVTVMTESTTTVATTTSTTVADTAVSTSATLQPLPPDFKTVQVDLGGLIATLGVPTDWIVVHPEDLADAAVRERVAKQIDPSGQGDGLLDETVIDRGVPFIFSRDGRHANIEISSDLGGVPTPEQMREQVLQLEGAVVDHAGVEDVVGAHGARVRYHVEQSQPLYGEVLVVNAEPRYIALYIKSLDEQVTTRLTNVIIGTLVPRPS